MKILPTNRAIAIALIASSLILFSCQKENDLYSEETQTETSEEDAANYADESAQASASFDDVEDLGMIAAEEEAAFNGSNGRIIPFLELRVRIGACADITVSPNDSTYPKTITIDFGDGCLCADGKESW